MTILNTIITGQVRRCFCGGNQVISCNCILQARHIAGNQCCTHFFIGLCSFHNSIANAIVNSFAKEFFRQCNFHALDVFSNLCSIIFHRLLGNCSIMWVITCNRIQEQSTIIRTLCNRPDLIQRGCKCNQAISGNTTISWLQSGNATECRRLTNRTTCI